MKIWKYLRGASVALMLMTGGIYAQSLDEGIAAWLDDDDATALPILSDLANQGNKEAQFILGQMDRITPPGADSEFVLGLERRDRIRLLRAQQGLSGRGWTVVREREGDELAAALNASRLPDAGIEIAQFLYENGERQAGARLAFDIFDRGNISEIMSLPSDDPLLQSLDFVRWIRSYFGSPPSPNAWNWLNESPAEGRGAGLMMVSFVAPILAPHLRPSMDLRRFTLAMRGAPAELMDELLLPNAAGVIRQQIEDDPELRVVGRLCSEICPDQVGYCAIDAITRVGGYDRLLGLHTPYEAAISQETFLESRRARNMLMRWMVSTEQQFDLAGGRVISQCLKRAVEEAGTAAAN
jgi:hypothetical protein